MKKNYILALDAGTTSSRALLYNRDGETAGAAQQEFPQIFPKSGWVEHDPMDIWQSQAAVAGQVLKEASIHPEEIAAIGITNQRETTILWEKHTGKPVFNAIVWQDRRTAPQCELLKQKGLEQYVRNSTGLVIDSYFSGTKIEWILDNVKGVREQAEKGDILFGTVDTWLLWNLTGGAVHRTDYTNASRTMLYNINTLSWDTTLLEAMNIPEQILPEVLPSTGVFGLTKGDLFDGVNIPVAGIAGDQQAALFGQTCFSKGMAKNTYGTGSFILMNTGGTRVESKAGLISTIAWGLDDRVEYALEGSIFVTGAAVQWLRDELRIIDNAAESEKLAMQVESTDGVYVVPAFAGLGAPYWDMYARGTIVGITRGTGREHIVRATLESLAYQTRDVVECMEIDSGIKLTELKVDGGASANNFLMQFQADILGVPVKRPGNIETTARGAAFLAGLAVDFWHTIEELNGPVQKDRLFSPRFDEKTRNSLYEGWHRAVERSRSWEEQRD